MLKVTAAILAMTVCAFTAILLADPPEAEGQYKAELSGWQETPPVVTAASGEAVAGRERSSDSVRITVRYERLSGTPVLVALQLAQPGMEGGAVAFLCGGGANSRPCQAAPAEVTLALEAADVLAIASQGLEAGQLEPVLAALDKGLLYVNVATPKFPAGEIRGQLVRGRRGDGEGEKDN